LHVLSRDNSFPPSLLKRPHSEKKSSVVMSTCKKPIFTLDGFEKVFCFVINRLLRMTNLICVEETSVTQLFSFVFRDSGPASTRLHSGVVCRIMRIHWPMPLSRIVLSFFLFWHFKTCSCKNILKICVPLQITYT